MAIIVVSRWKGSYEQALPIVREASPILKGAGATSVRAGVCHSGPGTALIHTEVTFPDWAAYGKAQHNTEFRRVFAEFLKVVELQDRSFIIGEEL
jgi:hypothetical protein